MMLHELLRGVEGGILAAKGSLRTGCYWDMVPSLTCCLPS